MNGSDFRQKEKLLKINGFRFKGEKFKLTLYLRYKIAKKLGSHFTAFFYGFYPFSFVLIKYRNLIVEFSK